MQPHHENINYEKNSPFKIFLHTLRHTPHHWHNEIELLFVLDGKMSIIVNGLATELVTDDLFLVNSNVVHSTGAQENNLVLILQMNQEYFDRFIIGFSKLAFRLNTTAADAKQNQFAHNQVRKLLAMIIETVNKEQENNQLLAMSHLFRLVHTLADCFQKEGEAGQTGVVLDDPKLRDVTDFIERNYKQDLSTEHIADAVHLSRSYLSRYFSQKMGIPLAEYLTEVRLKNSTLLLTDTDESITNIAFSSGFSSVKTYYNVFSKVYATTPSKYRKQYTPARIKAPREFDYLNITAEKPFEYLYQYLPQHNFSEERGVQPVRSSEIRLDVNRTRGKYQNNMRKLGCFGRAAEGLRDDWRAQFKYMQQNIGFSYYRFHGIFCDDMDVCQIKEGRLAFNFDKVDRLFDFMLENNARPFVEIGFMPTCLASGTANVFEWKGNTTPPKEMQQWLCLVRMFFVHILERYGQKEVAQWYFEIWNEPDLSAFWHGSQEQYIEFFIKTFKEIKLVHSVLRVGGFSMTQAAALDTSRMLQIAKKLNDEDVSIDFFTFHCYPLAYSDAELEDVMQAMQRDKSVTIQQINKAIMRSGVYAMREAAQRIKKIAGALFPTAKEFFITEWNAGCFPRDLVLDTCYMATFLARNLSYFNDIVDGAGFWVFTDIFEEMPIPPEEFHGGFGLLTQHGIPKPHFFAYRYFLQMKGELLYQSDDCLAVRAPDGTVRMLLNNYAHFDKPYSRMDASGVTLHRRNTCFADECRLTVAIVLSGADKHACVRRFEISEESASAFDEWLRMGAPTKMDDENIRHLCAQLQPRLTVQDIKLDGTCAYHTTLAANSVVFIEIVV